MAVLDRITINPKQCGGKPCIRGMRFRVIDILELLADGLGVPPQIVWLRFGNMRTVKMRLLFSMTFAKVLRYLDDGYALVEVDEAGRCTAS
jgi:hypothetical protein